MESKFWHPFADMSKVIDSRLTISKGDGSWVWDNHGSRYLDATASLWYLNIGHGRDEVIDAIVTQAKYLEAYSAFGDYTNEPAELLCHKLTDLSTIERAKVFLTAGGGDAVDTAIKLARFYFASIGEAQKQHVISRHRAYHGTHGIGTSIGGIAVNRTGFGDLGFHTSTIPFDDASALESEILRVGAENVACFVAEPIIGAGGVYLPPERYFEDVRRICDRYEVLLLVDSVICGFGRLGTWFGIERFEVIPDITMFAKGVTSGYQPLGGLIISANIADLFYNNKDLVFRHGQTYAGHPLACAAALRNIQIIEDEHLLDRVHEFEGLLFNTLRVVETSDVVDEVRGGIGLMGAVQLSEAFLKRFDDGATMLQMAMRERGVLVRPLGGAIAVSPPLIINASEIEIIGEALLGAIKELETLT